MRKKEFYVPCFDIDALSKEFARRDKVRQHEKNVAYTILLVGLAYIAGVLLYVHT